MNLAALGQIGLGMDQSQASYDAAQARQLAIEHSQRVAELERQQLEDQRRQQAFQSDLRDMMPKYLAGGAQGTPGQAPIAMTNDDEGNPMPDGSAITVQREQAPQDNTMGMLEAARSLAVKHGRMQDFEGFNKRVSQYEDEGLLDFVKKARQGASTDELMDTFNKTGKVKLARLQESPTEDGVYVGATTDGKPVKFDLDSMTESLLAPKDYMAHSDKSDLAAAKLIGTQNTLTAKREALKAGEDAAAALAEARRARAEKDQALAGGAQGARTSGNWNQYDGQVRQHANAWVTQPDPDNPGKTIVDRKAAVKLSSMASALARSDPTLSPAEAVQSASDKLQELQQLQDQSTTQAEEESKGLTFESPQKRDKWVRNRASTLTRVHTPSDPRDPTSPAPTPAKAAPAAAAPGDLPKPVSQADFDALPSGARFINPADGMVRIKK